MDIRKNIENWYPNIKDKDFKIIKSNNIFNCVSFSLDIYDYWLWTNEIRWPSDIPRNLGIESFKLLYEKFGYIKCDSESYEEGYDKIAFYGKNNIPKHTSKQYGNMWRSKVGLSIIEHELNWLCGDTEDAYGDIVFIMKRKK